MSGLVLHQPSDRPPIAYVGLVARADLLPKEVRDLAARRAGRRLAVLLLILSVAIVGAGYAFVWTLSLSAQLGLSSAQSRTVQLTLQQGEFQSVRDLQSQVSVLAAANRVGSATAVEWVGLVGALTGSMPTDAEVGTLTLSMQSPINAVPPASTPLATPRIGQIQMTASGSDLVPMTVWLDALKADPTFSAIDVASAIDSEGWVVTLTASVSPTLTAMPTEDPQ